MKLFLLLSIFTFNILAKTKKFKLEKGFFKIINISGNISVIGSKSKMLTIESHKIKWSDKCKIIISKRGNKVLTEIKRDLSFISSHKCSVDFIVRAPPQIALNINARSSNVLVSKMDSSIRFHIWSGRLLIEKSHLSKVNGLLKSGNVSFLGKFKDIKLRTMSAGVNLEGSFKNINLKTGSGTIYAKINDPIDETIFIARSGSGNVFLQLPKEKTTNVEYKSGAGNLKDKTSHADKADLIIKVKTGSGNLKISTF